MHFLVLIMIVGAKETAEKTPKIDVVSKSASLWNANLLLN